MNTPTRVLPAACRLVPGAFAQADDTANFDDASRETRELLQARGDAWRSAREAFAPDGES